MNAAPDTIADSNSKSTQPAGFTRRLGGRHLIFRNHESGWSWIPRPYALISDFSGPVWFFYGLGQIWLSHQVVAEFDGWKARVPRIGGGKIKDLVSRLEPELTEFAHLCNEQGIEGTLVMELGLLEFHWTFDYDLKQERDKPEHADRIADRFQKLARAFEQASAVTASRN